MKKKTTYWLNVIFMIVLLAVTFSVLFRGQDVPQIIEQMRHVSQTLFFAAFVCAVLYLVLQSISLWIILKSLGSRIRFFSSIRYSFIGFLFNAITPSASGGQPMQVVYMNMDGINFGESSLALLFWTILYKVSLLVIQTGALIGYHAQIKQALGNALWLYILGIVVNAVSILIYAIIVFSKNGAKNIVKAATWLLGKLRIVKHRQTFENRLDVMLTSYQNGADYMKTHINIAIYVLLVTILQRIIMFAGTWFIYRSLGLDTYSFLWITILQSLVSVCIDIIPLPGGVGVNESFFVTLFQKYVEKKQAFSMMLLSRGVNFYGLLIISVFITIIPQFFAMLKEGHGKHNT